MNNMINLHKKIMKQHQSHFWKTHSSYLFNICSTFVQHLFNIWLSNLVPQFWPCDTSAGRLCDAGGVHLGAVDHEGPSEGHRCENHRRWSRWYLGGNIPQYWSIRDIRYPKYVNYVENWIGFGDSTYFAIKFEFWDDETMGFEGSQVHKSETYGDGMGHITLLFGGMKSHIRPDLLRKCRNVSCDWDGRRKTQWTPTGTFIHIHTLMDFYPFILWACLVFSIKLVFWTYNLSQLPSTATPVEFQFFPSLWRSLGQLRAMTLAKSFEEWSDGCRTSSFLLLSVAAPLHVKGGAVHSIWTLKIPLWYVEVALMFRSWVIGCQQRRGFTSSSFSVAACCSLGVSIISSKRSAGCWPSDSATWHRVTIFFTPERLDDIWIYGDPSPWEDYQWWRLLMLSMPEVTNTSMMYDGWFLFGPTKCSEFWPVARVTPVSAKNCEESHWSQR